MDRSKIFSLSGATKCSPLDYYQQLLKLAMVFNHHTYIPSNDESFVVFTEKLTPHSFLWEFTTL